MPSVPGILTSIRITSGRSSPASATPSAPSAASPTTSMSPWTSRNVRSPRRTTWWSSTSSTRITWSATGHLHLDDGALAGPRLHVEPAADAGRPVPHGDQSEVPPGAADGRGVEAAAVVAHPQPGALAAAFEGDRDGAGVGVPQRVVHGLLG